MPRKIDLGTFAVSGKPFLADLDIIMRSNVLAQANSGGGKSWLLRRMIEQAFGKVPQIVIDPEGEFSTLRERFDFVLVGQGGDTPADVRAAPLLATRLLELGASAVVDLYEMPKQQRPAWVAAFINALVDAPKKLWRNLLVYVDEAHEMAPEPGHGISDSPAEKACRSALIGLGSKGRKRGYGFVAATQRLGKLSKDVAAELKNALVGQTWIDIDRERAAGQLGIAKADKAAFFRDVKTLEPGNFFVLGRAFALEPIPVRVGPVQTEHPQAGIRQSAPPPPTDKIRHLLPQLADLPKEAEQKIKTEAELRAEIARLQRELGKKPEPAIGPERRVEVPVVPAEWSARLEQAAASARTMQAESLEAAAKLGETVTPFLRDLAYMREIGEKYRLPTLAPRPAPAQQARQRGAGGARELPPRGSGQDGGRGSIARATVGATEPRLGLGERKVLTAIAQHGEAGVTRGQLTVLTGYKRSTRDAYVQRLRVAGHVEDGERITATEQGIAALGHSFEPLPTGHDLLEHWLRELPEGERACLQVAVGTYPEAVERDAIGDATGYKRSTRDAYLQRLRSRQLVEDVGRGQVRASAELFG